ncbi:MAG: hypothetical protein KJ077_12440 [Anaerolineae bacterium]|nr:hypothetical protein [Anaerolineae bacterium]
MNTVTLSNGQIVEVPQGADPAYFKRFEEARLRLAANPKPKKAKKSSSSRKPTKRSSYARMQSVLAISMLELVERVNAKEGGE